MWQLKINNSYLLVLQRFIRMIGIYALNIKQPIVADRFKSLLCLTDNGTQEKIKRLKNHDDALRTLLADILTRTIIIKKLGIKNNEIQFTVNDYGKPSLESDIIHFNKSHSGEWVVCAVSDSPIGVDIEQIKHIDFNIARQFFSEEEYIYLMEKPDEQKLGFFYDLWTLKESYVKFKGDGLSISLNSFSIKFSSQGISVAGSKKENVFFKHYHIDRGYSLAACSNSEKFPRDILRIDVNYIFGLCGVR